MQGISNDDCEKLLSVALKSLITNASKGGSYSDLSISCIYTTKPSSMMMKQKIISMREGLSTQGVFFGDKSFKDTLSIKHYSDIIKEEIIKHVCIKNKDNFAD